jgi:hypothetical protein
MANRPPLPPCMLLPCPAVICIVPPTSLVSVVQPAVMDKSPPFPLVPLPTATTMSPPFPFVAAPVPIEIDPDVPELDVPELNTRVPLVPLEPALAVRYKMIEPLLVIYSHLEYADILHITTKMLKQRKYKII